MLLGTHILTIVGQFVQQFATWNLCLYVETDIVPTILDHVHTFQTYCSQLALFTIV